MAASKEEILDAISNMTVMEVVDLARIGDVVAACGAVRAICSDDNIAMIQFTGTRPRSSKACSPAGRTSSSSRKRTSRRFLRWSEVPYSPPQGQEGLFWKV